MPKYVVSTKDEFKEHATTATSIAKAEVPGLTVKGNLRAVTVEGEETAINQLKERLGNGFIVEPVIYHYKLG